MSEDSGSGGNLKLDEKVSTLVQDLRTAHEELNTAYAQATAISGAVPAVWRGLAGSSLAGLQNRVAESLRELRDSAGVMADLLEMSLGGFDEEEERQVQEMTRLQGTLDDGPPTTIAM